MNREQTITEAFSSLNIDPDETQISQLLRFYDMLTEKNKVMNLTAITGFEETVIRHFVDSVSLINIFPISDPSGLRILDIGTGAGFPGIPLKIVFPEIDITLLDSLTKRIRFIDEVIEELGLNSSGHIETVDMRAEDYVRKPDIRESYDLVVSRAVADLAVLSEYALPYVKTGGSFVSYKGDKAQEETEHASAAIELLGGQISDILTFTLPGSDIGRTLINIKKTCPTPDKYPRKAGLPSKKPLK